jgi:hypothetical protein
MDLDEKAKLLKFFRTVWKIIKKNIKYIAIFVVIFLIIALIFQCLANQFECEIISPNKKIKRQWFCTIHYNIANIINAIKSLPWSYLFTSLISIFSWDKINK